MPPLAPAASAVSPRSVLARRAAELIVDAWDSAQRRVVLRADGGDGACATRGRMLRGYSRYSTMRVLATRHLFRRQRDSKGVHTLSPPAGASRNTDGPGAPSPHSSRSPNSVQSAAPRSRDETSMSLDKSPKARTRNLLQHNRSWADKISLHVDHVRTSRSPLSRRPSILVRSIVSSYARHPDGSAHPEQLNGNPPEGRLWQSAAEPLSNCTPMPTKRERCFIAMAFGEDDTNAVYDKLIKPALRTEGVTPVRVDRREHNRNINDVIMEELARSEFVVADLTYARPSVYFEAGFGERAGTVIYTVRADHLKANGEERVHFDVSMRNIITWRSPKDPTFATRLRRRVRHVLKPIRAARKEVQERRSRESAFLALPSRKQVEVLQHDALEFLRSRGMTEERGAQGLASKFHVRSGKMLRSICVVVLEKWVRGALAVNYLASAMMLPAIAAGRSDIRNVEHHLVLATTQSVAFSKIRSAFPDASADVGAKTVTFSRGTAGVDASPSARGRTRAGPVETMFVHLIDAVKSQEGFITSLTRVLPVSNGHA